MLKQLLTLDQLYEFCAKNNFTKFSSKDSGYTLSVQVPGSLSFDANKDDETTLYAKIKVCHTGVNRNNSSISEEVMKKALPTLQYKPILASIVETSSGEFDFNGHDMELVEDENGEKTINYIEKQVGAFTSDEPYLEEEDDRQYVIAYAAIPRGYTAAADIIERKGGTDVSCEMIVNEMSFSSKDKCIVIEDFMFTATTLLGNNVAPGMQGAHLDIVDFSTEKNSIHYSVDEKLIETLDRLNQTLSSFNINAKDSGKEENKLKFEELLLKYNKTVEDITFEYENLSDEELEAAFEKAFAESEEAEEFSNDETTEENFENETPEESESNTDNVKFSVTVGETTREFSKNLSDVIYVLNQLVNEQYADDMTYYGVSVYEGETGSDNFVIMEDYCSGRAYRQTYKCKKDKYSLTGDRIEVYREWVTENERTQLNSMRSNYSAISDKLAKYEAEPQKMEILESKDYARIAESKEFMSLMSMENHFDLSVDEVRDAADKLLLAYAKSESMEFSAKQPENKKSSFAFARVEHKADFLDGLLNK